MDQINVITLISWKGEKKSTEINGVKDEETCKKIAFIVKRLCTKKVILKKADACRRCEYTRFLGQCPFKHKHETVSLVDGDHACKIKRLLIYMDLVTEDPKKLAERLLENKERAAVNKEQKSYERVKSLRSNKYQL